MLSIQIPSDIQMEKRPVRRAGLSPLLKDRSDWKAVVYDVWKEKEQASMIYDDVHRRLKRLRKYVYRVKESTYMSEARVILHGICVLEKMNVGMLHVRLMMMLSDLDELYSKTDDME
jgi:hypothetical protein